MMYLTILYFDIKSMDTFIIKSNISLLGNVKICVEIFRNIADA